MENLRVFFLGSLLLLAGGVIYKLRSENDVITFTVIFLFNLKEIIFFFNIFVRN